MYVAAGKCHARRPPLLILYLAKKAPEIFANLDRHAASSIPEEHAEGHAPFPASRM